MKGVGEGPHLWFRCDVITVIVYVGVGQGPRLWFRCDHSDCLCRCGSGASAVVQVSSQ